MSIFIEIVFSKDQGADLTVQQRQELELALDEALQSQDLGETTGGGAGPDTANVDVEIEDDQSEEVALWVIRTVLWAHDMPAGTRILKRGETPNAYVLGVKPTEQ